MLKNCSRWRSGAWRLVTTNVVVFEAHALVLHRSQPGHETALKFWTRFKMMLTTWFGCARTMKRKRSH